MSRRLLAQIEAGEANPSLSTLLSIAAGFDISLVELLAGSGTPAVTVQRDNASAPVLWTGDEGGAARLLVGADPLELWTWTLEPGDERRSEAHRPGSREAVLVTRGTLTLRSVPRTSYASGAASRPCSGPTSPTPTATTRRRRSCSSWRCTSRSAVPGERSPRLAPGRRRVDDRVPRRATLDARRPAPGVGVRVRVRAATLLMVVLVASGLAAGEAGDVVDSGRHWAPWVLVAAVSGIELGVLAMYRAGWGIGSASISAQALTAAILVLVGLAAFGEHLTLARGTGLLLCASGAALLVHR